jgi:hypothetical protein
LNEYKYFVQGAKGSENGHVLASESECEFCYP